MSELETTDLKSPVERGYEVRPERRKAKRRRRTRTVRDESQISTDEGNPDAHTR